MSDLNVRMIDLPAMRVAATLGFGAEPEAQAWQFLWDWVKEQGLEATASERRFFGFNNPDPHPGSSNYGYEQWMTIDGDATGTKNVTIKEIPAGRYAVLHCPGIPNPVIWRSLVRWCEERGYVIAMRNCLEELLTPTAPFEQWEFDLYLPLAGSEW